MKFTVLALLFATAAAFQPPTMTFAVGKKKTPAAPTAKEALKKTVNTIKDAKLSSDVKIGARNAAGATKGVDQKSKQAAGNLFNKAQQAAPNTKPLFGQVKAADQKAKQNAGKLLSQVKSADQKSKQNAGSLFNKAKAAVPNANALPGQVKGVQQKANQAVKPLFGQVKAADQKSKQQAGNLFNKAKSAAPSARSVISKAKSAVPNAKPLFSAVKSADRSAKKNVAGAVRPAVAKIQNVSRFAPKGPVVRKATKQGATKLARDSNQGLVPSTAIPYENAPATLDGSFVGDVGFDPCFLSTKADSVANYFNGLFNNNVNIDGLTWYREAELMHGRIAMIAVLGFIVPGFGTLSGNEWTGYDAFSYKNPLDELARVPSASLFQIFAFMAALEFRRINIINEQGSNYMAGDSQRWGQGDGRWNPFNFNYSPDRYAEKQLQEIKHGRLAMIGLLGLYFQANASGINVVEQWSNAFTIPDYVAKAGYYLPEGI